MAKVRLQWGDAPAAFVHVPLCCLQDVVGVPFEQAVGAATEVPARFLTRGDVGFLESAVARDFEGANLESRAGKFPGRRFSLGQPAKTWSTPRAATRSPSRPE